MFWANPLSLLNDSDNKEPTDTDNIESVNLQSDIEPLPKLLIPGPNSKATEEYLQAPIFRARQLTITLHIRSGAYDVSKQAPEIWQVPPIHQTEARKLIQAATHLTIRTEVGYMHHRERLPPERLHALHGALLRVLATANPALATIRLAVHLVGNFFALGPRRPWDKDGHEWTRGVQDPESVPFVPPMYGFPMPMAQQAELRSLRLEKSHTWYRPPLTFSVGETTAALFVKEACGNESRFWREDEVAELFPGIEMLKMDEDEEYEAYESYAREARRWTDRRVDVKEALEDIRLGEVRERERERERSWRRRRSMGLNCRR